MYVGLLMQLHMYIRRRIYFMLEIIHWPREEVVERINN